MQTKYKSQTIQSCSLIWAGWGNFSLSMFGWVLTSIVNDHLIHWLNLVRVWVQQYLEGHRMTIQALQILETGGSKLAKEKGVQGKNIATFSRLTGLVQCELL